MTFKKKKVKKYRGSKTHGCGSMKKRRGAGNRGGRGRSGSGKRGDQKKPSYWKDKPVKGFSPKNTSPVNAINLNDLIAKVSGSEIINLQELGYDKLLGTGTITRKLEIHAKYASKRAIEKVSNAGGKVVVEHADLTPEQK